MHILYFILLAKIFSGTYTSKASATMLLNTEVTTTEPTSTFEVGGQRAQYNDKP